MATETPEECSDRQLAVIDGMSPEDIRMCLIWMSGANPDMFDAAVRSGQRVNAMMAEQRAAREAGDKS